MTMFPSLARGDAGRFPAPALGLRILLLALALEAPATQATTWCVNLGGTGGCFGTIFNALNAAADGDTIRIGGAASPYLEHLTIMKSVSLVGDGAASTIIDGGASGQVIRILTPVTVTLANLTIQNGQAGTGNVPDQYGGGIHNENGALTLESVIVTGNRTGGGNTCCGGYGGGIYTVDGTLTLNNSSVSANWTGTPTDNLQVGGVGGSGGDGAGIYSRNATVTLNDSAVFNNVTGNGANGGSSGGSGGDGGGIYKLGGLLVLNRSLVRGNVTGVTGSGGTTSGTSGSGAGIFLASVNATISNSTLSGNLTGWASAAAGGDGGGLYAVLSTVNIVYSTLAFNQVDAGQAGGGITILGGIANIEDSLVAYNTTNQGPLYMRDCSGTLTSLGYNVMTEPDCTITPTTGDQFYVRGTILGPLEDNGGPTLTHALVPGSPAIDAADNSACPITDQRGRRRPENGGTSVRCDVGAFEVQAPSAYSVLTPCRLFDTRNATGPDAASPILAAGEIRTLSAASKCSLPAGAKVLSVNETVTGQTVDGGLLLFRGDLTWTPTASSLSFRPGITRSNNGIVEVTGDGTGSFKVFNNSTGAVHFILDVNGYFQ